MKVTNSKVIALMARIGGGFASALANAWQKADLDNQRRLMQAFGDLYDTYDKLQADIGAQEQAWDAACNGDKDS